MHEFLLASLKPTRRQSARTRTRLRTERTVSGAPTSAPSINKRNSRMRNGSAAVPAASITVGLWSSIWNCEMSSARLSVSAHQAPVQVGGYVL